MSDGQRLNYLPVTNFTVVMGGTWVDTVSNVVDVPIHAVVFPPLLDMDASDMPAGPGETIMVASGQRKIGELEFRYFQSEADTGILHRKMLEWYKQRKNSDIERRYHSLTVKALDNADRPVYRWTFVRNELRFFGPSELNRQSGGTFIERTVRVLPQDIQESMLDNEGRPMPAFDTGAGS